MHEQIARRSQIAALRAAARAVVVPPRMGVAEWADRYRVLDPKASAIPGPWRTDRVPYLRAIMEALDPRHPAERVVLCKSAQTAGSEAAINWLCWSMHQAPAPALVGFPTEKLGLRWMRGRMKPAMRAARDGVLRGLDRADQGSNTQQELHFPGGVLYLASANVASDLSSVPVAHVLLDEVDRMPREIEGEGDPIELAWARTNTFVGRRKMALISTPTDSGSPIDKAYQESSRGRYFVPCPHCAGMQHLQWSQLEWPEGEPEKAAYRCEHCDKMIDESAKDGMLAGGEWRHEKPELASLHIGFHINCLYAPRHLGQSWAQNARAYEVAKRDPAKLQTFTNTNLGQVHRGENVKVDWETVKDRREPGWLQRTIPRGYYVLTAGVDVQGNRLEVQVLAWGPGEVGGAERCAVIDYTVFHGDPTQPETWVPLLEYLRTPIANADGRPLKIRCTMVDAGFCQSEVIAFAHANRADHIYASRGAKRIDKKPIDKPTPMDVNFRGKTHKRGAELYWLGVSEIKRQIYARLAADAEVLPAEAETRFIRFNGDLGDNYFRMLCAEVFVGGKWVLEHERNEALDVTVYGFAAAGHHTLQIPRWREADWKRVIEQQQAPKGEEKPTRAMPTRAIVR